MYIVQTWTPGYLPEDDDPFTTDDLTEARQALSDLIERDWDDDYGQDPDDTPTEYVTADNPTDARYLDAHASVNSVAVGESLYVPAPSWQAHGLGRCYGISETEEG